MRRQRAARRSRDCFARLEKATKNEIYESRCHCAGRLSSAFSSHNTSQSPAKMKAKRAPQKREREDEKESAVAKKGALEFKRRPDGTLIFDDAPDFRPSLLPQEVLA